MAARLQVRGSAARLSRRRSLALLGASATWLTGCSASSILSGSKYFSGSPSPAAAGTPGTDPAIIGGGDVKVGLILPLTAGGNAGLAGQALRNAADMAVAEFNGPNIQITVEDDAGNPDVARGAAQQALEKGARIILGPMFAQSVNAVGQVTRPANIPVIAFSTDSSVASPGVYLLSFLPESDVRRIVAHASATGKRSFAALMPQNPYGTVVEAAFRQDVARHGGRIVALEHYPHDQAGMADPVRSIARSASHADALFIPDGGDFVPDVVQALVADGMNVKRIQLLGTGLWDDPRVFSAPALVGGWYAAPAGNGYRAFSERYRKRYGQDPVRTATLAYDAVALVAALVKTRTDPEQRFSAQTLTNPSGFTGIDGLFRFMPDGTNQRGLAVLRVTSTGPQVVAPAPRNFGGSAI